ncbi:MAG: thioredoxin-family protein [Caulobacteraceae bacterium]|nr:thioredoxin-family protein [Caulobacteraceae bacterium]
MSSRSTDARGENGRRSVCILVGGLLLAFLAALVSSRAAPSIADPAWKRLTFIDAQHPQAPTSPAGRAAHARVLMLWRADCGPCLIELKHMAALQAAAGPADLIAVALDDPHVAQAKLADLGLRPRRLWYALGSNAVVLNLLGGPPPRLPLSVAVDPRGDICARRTGLLGTDIVRQWVARCSS